MGSDITASEQNFALGEADHPKLGCAGGQISSSKDFEKVGGRQQLKDSFVVGLYPHVGTELYREWSGACPLTEAPTPQYSSSDSWLFYTSAIWIATDAGGLPRSVDSPTSRACTGSPTSLASARLHDVSASFTAVV